MTESLATYTIEAETAFTSNTVRHKSGAGGSGNDGTPYGVIKNIDISPADEMWLSYDMTFGPTFDWTWNGTGTDQPNGKIPGLASRGNPLLPQDQRGNANCASIKPEGWSAQSMWHGNGRMVSYLYFQDRGQACGEKLQWLESWPGGAPLHLSVGQRYRFDQRIKINTPNVADGVIQIWIDGILRYQKTDVRWRGDTSGLSSDPIMALARAARIDLFKMNNYYELTGPTFDSFVTFSRFYLWDHAPDFDAPLSDEISPRAFPEARGYGAFTHGGEGGLVKFVTNLDNDGAGSFREACRGNYPRIVQFSVAGTINLVTDLLVGNPFCTIMGETAPSPGITITGSPLAIKSNNIIVRHIASRPGNLIPPTGFDNRDCLQIEHAQNVIIDHCSFSWSVDECATGWFEDTDNVTIQWCIIAEPLWNAGHSKGSHPMGMLFGRGTGHVSIHHNLFAQVGFRSPEISSGVRCDIVNNVIYNWGQRGTTISSGDKDYLGPSLVNIMNNIYKPGAHSLPANEGRIITGMGLIPPVGYQVYINGNVDHLGASANTSDGTEPGMVVGSPVDGGAYDVTVDSTTGLFAAVLAGAGRLLPARDATDTRVVNDVTNGIARKAHSMADIAGWS